MPKYGTIDSGLTTLSTQELYEQNKQDTQQREERFIDPQQDFANTIQTRSKYGTPIEEPIGNMFIPFGGVKPVDENAIQDIEDLQDIPEARAQSQTTGKLIANSLGQTLNELTVGLGYGVAQLFDDDIAKTNAGDQNFENAASAYFKDIQNNINEDVFPIYQTHKSEEGNFIDKLGDGTWWASNFPQIASTAQMLIPALGTSSAIRMLGEVGKKSRIAKMLTNGLSIDAALAKDAEFINTIGSIGAAGISRHIENNMEASQTFQQVYQEYLQKGITDEQAKKLAGEAAARNWKYNLALLSSDILQYSTLLKPFKSFGKIAEGLQTSKLAKIAKPLTVAVPESIEEATQFITSAEAGQNKPFDADFFSKRLADYIADPQLQTAAYWGGLGGSGMYASGPLMRKISQASANLATGKITAATFGDTEKAKNLDQDTFNDLLSRNYSINKLDRMESDMKAFHDDYTSKPDITPEEKQEISDKYKDWTNQINFVKETDKNALSDPKFQKNPETRKSFVLQQLEAKNLAEDISTNKGIIDSYYSELPSAYNDVKSVNKEVNKLKALKSLQKSVKASNFHDIKKDYHLNDIEKQIIVQEAKVNSAKESYRISTGKEYAKQILPQEFIATVAHSRLERDQFKHDNIIQPELLKYHSDSEEKIAEKEQEITKKQKETNKKAAEEAVESAETSEDIEDITSAVGTEEFEANNPPEVAEAIFGNINKKAKGESVIKGTSIISTPEGEVNMPIVPNRWDDGIHKFTAEKVGFIGKLISLEDKTPEETSMIKKLGSSRKDAMYANLVEAQKYPRIAQEVNNFFNQQDKLQSKSTEEKELDKQINKLQSNPVDSEVEGTIEPSINFTTIISQEDIEVKIADIEKKRNVELKNRVIYDEMPSIQTGEFRIIGDPNKTVYRINETNGKLQRKDENGLWTKEGTHGKIELETAKRSGFEKLKENINAKYDAELEALDKIVITEKSNVFHINASQYKVNNIEGKRQIVGDKLPFANQFNWEAINNLPIGSELTAKIDPDHVVYIAGKPLRNGEVAPNQQLVSLFSEDGVEVGILYTQNEANKALFPVWRSEVQSKGEKKFKVVQKYKGDINTYTEIKDGDITIPAARNSLTDIERAYGQKLILGYIHGTTAGSIVRTPNKDIPEIRLGAKSKSGQIVVALPKGNGEYMAYGLVTKSLKQGEGVDYKNVPLAENNAFREVLDSLKGLQVGNIEGNEILIDKLHSFVSLPTIISTNKKTGTPYIQFNPVHIKKKHLEAFKNVKGINSYLREDKKDSDPGAYVVLVSKDIIDNLQLTEYDKGTPEAVMMNFLGEMKLQIDGSKLNQDDYYETVSKRTKTNLANDPVVNVSFFIQPTTDEAQLTPKEVDATVQQSKIKDISDIKKEEELPTKELEDIKTNITEVSNLDQTDGKPVKIETTTKRGRTTLVRKPKLSTGEGNYKVWNKEKELNWLSKQLPNIPVEVLSDISDLQQGLDVDVYGRFEDGMIYLAENTKVGTTYHEAFHTVFWVGLKPSQRTVILKQAKLNFGEFSDNTLEEILADNFAEYVQTEGNTELKGNFIKNFFEKIYNWIKYNVFGQVEIKNLYYRINSGQYANLKPVKVNVSKLSSSLRPAVFEDRVNTLVANFSLAIDNYIDEHPELTNLTRTQLLKSIDTGETSSSIEYFLTQAYNSLYEDYESDPDSTWGKQMAVFLNETVKAVTPGGKVLWGPIGKKALQKIGAREGFKVHANQILGVQNANPDEDYDISEEEARSEGWQVDVKSQSGQMGLSNEVRKELSYIPLTGDKAIDDLGYQRYVDFDSAHATLMRELADLGRRDRVEKKLKELVTTTRPELIGIYNKFISEDPANEIFKTHLVNDFAKTHVDFKMAVQKNDGRVVIYSSNSTTIVNMIIDNWQSEFYNNGYFTPDGNVNVDKITPIINEILKAPTVVEKMKLFDDKFNLDLDSRVFNNISQDMLYLIGDLKAGNNIFETNTSKLKDLAKLDAKYKTDLLESSFRNIEGKTVYSHILPSFTSKQIANMKYDFDTWYEYYSTDPFYKNSPLLNAILKDKSILENLEYSMIDGSKYKGESEGTSYADFSDKQFLSMQINMFHNNGTKNYGWYQTPILSDSPEGVYIKLPKYKTSDALDKLVEVAKQEYERIKDSHDNKLGVKNFDENANKFLFMTFLRRPDLEKSDEEIKEIIGKGLGNKFKDYWDFLQKNNIFDLSDNLGVTRELIPNYFKLKEEKRTTLTEEELDVVKTSMWNYFLNQVYAGSQIITLTTGDPAFYKSVTDYYKRAKEIVSPTMQMDASATYILSEEEINNEGSSEQVITPGENYTTLYLNDVNIVGQIGKELFDTFTKTGDIFYAQTAAKYGYSNDKDGKFLEFEVEGKKYKFKSDLVNVADAQTFISPNRYRKVAVGYGRWNKQIQQTFGRMVSNKTLLPEDYDVAIQPYKPFVFGHIKQGNKIIPVQNKNSEMTLFPQLAKASPTLQKLYDIMQENNLDSISFESVVKVGLSNTVSWEDLQNGVDIKDKIHTLDNSNYGLQQEVPAHYIDDSALFGTQIMKHIIANLDLTANYNGRTGQELADYFQKLISENVEISYKQAREELGLSGDIVDNKKLSEILQREILSRDLGEDIFEAAGLDMNGEFNIHPADPLHNDRNEKLLNSIYKNRVTKQKIKGGSFVQASGIGFMDSLNMVTKKNPDGTIKSIDYVECMLPWSSRKYFEPFMDEDGLIDIKKVQKTNPDLLDMIGYRIPTEDKYSMLPLRVVGFLPAQMGGVVMLPMEITTLAGSDFDVDKLYIMMPEFEISPDKQDIRKITDLETTEGRNNMLIDLMRDVLTNEKTFKQFIKPGGFVDLQKNANIVYLVTEKAAKYSEIIDWSDKQINDAVESLIAKQGIDLTSPLSNARMFNRNMTGKKLVGIEANHNANHSILQSTNVELSKPIIINGKTYQSLHDIYNNAGELISNNVAQRLAAVVDNAKDPNAFKANLNTYTADVDALLTRLGVPMIQSFALLKQPIVVELTRLYYLHGGDFNAEETAINEIYQKHPYPEQSAKDKGRYSPNLKRNSIDIPLNDLIEGLTDDWISDNQLFILSEFLLYKDKAKSLAKLINSMSSMTNGSGPTGSDNEVIIRTQREILTDENLVGVAELFSGAKYPLFKAFNDNGLIKPQEDLKKVFPLGNTDEDSWVNKTKLLLQNSIAKNKLSVKDLNKFNNFILSYISDGFELYDPKLQKYFVESFPAKYKETLELNPEIKEFRITKFIKFQQDDNFPFGRLEFNNTGALTNTLKDDLKDSWYQMFTDDNPETRKFALNLFRYSKYKEGFLFGPKTFTHLQPTKFFTSTEEGKVINKAWKKVFKAENLGMNDKDSERVVKQYIKNNWKNTGFVPIITESHKVTKEGDNPIAVNVNIKDSKYKTDIGFVEFVKVPVSSSRGKKVETTYVLMEKVYQTYNKQGQPITAVYRPTNKLGKSAYLVETNRMLDSFSSILPENNVGKVADVDIRKLASSSIVEETTETFESEENDVSLQEESKTLKDILESFELYESMFISKGITRESLTKMSEEELGKLLKEIC